MALSEKATNPFAGGELQDNIKAEKVKVLEMIAQHGTAGYKMYDDARSSLQEHDEMTTGKIDSGRFAPVAVLQSLAGRHREALDTAIGAVADLRTAEGEWYGSLSGSTGRVMDMAVADESGTKLFDERQSIFDSRTREMEANLREYALRARPPESTGGGGGGGGRSSSGRGFANSRTTLPIGLLNQWSGRDVTAPISKVLGGVRKTRTTRGSGGSRTFRGGKAVKKSSGQTASKRYSRSPSTWRGL